MSPKPKCFVTLPVIHYTYSVLLHLQCFITHQGVSILFGLPHYLGAQFHQRGSYIETLSVSILSSLGLGRHLQSLWCSTKSTPGKTIWQAGMHFKKCGVTEHPRGAIFYCFRGNSMGWLRQSNSYCSMQVAHLPWNVRIHPSHSVSMYPFLISGLQSCLATQDKTWLLQWRRKLSRWNWAPK